MYRHSAPKKTMTMLADADVETLPRVPIHAGHLRVERNFGTFGPNEPFPTSTRNDSMPDPSAGGLSAKDETILRLSRLQPENESQKSRHSVLLGELAEVLEQVEALTAEVNNDRTTRLTAEHKEVRKAGRIAEKALQKASEAYAGADVFAANMIEVQSQARQNLQRLHDLEQRGEHLKRFHSDQELADWRQKYSEYQDLAKAGAQMAEDAVRERSLRQEELTAARDEVGRLASEESRIRAELRGTHYWDPETGLGEPGAGVMTSEIAATMRTPREPL